MRLFKHKSLMGLIYACLLAVPMVAILSRVIYVQSNKNAYQSYSGTQTFTYYEKVEEQKPTGFIDNHLVIGNYYQFDFSIDDTEGLQDNFVEMNVYNCEISYISLSVDEVYIENHLVIYDKFFMTVQDSYVYIMYGPPDDYIAFEVFNIQFSGIVEVTYINGNVSLMEEFFSECEYYETTYIEHTQESSTLDNVFDYSVDSIIKENNLGKINFLGWFTDMFLDDNAVNNRYVGYVNWYMNYALFVSCAYILFLVLMWFVNFARRLLDRGMNYDW